jgi:hypothetical protein
MFSKPGKTLMDYSRTLFVALLIFVVGFGTFLIMAGEVVYGILLILGGTLAAFLTCLLLAAVGQAVESLRIIAISTHVIANEPIDVDEPVA